MSRARRFISWLDEAIDQFPQARATADQLSAYLRKNPRVSQDEIRDRGLDTFIEARAARGKPIDIGQRGQMGTVRGYLNRNPAMSYPSWLVEPEYKEWSTPGIYGYNERVYGNPEWDPRKGSSHFNERGYGFHTRGGWLEEADMGPIYIMDEIQSDVSQNMTPRFNPQGIDPPPRASLTAQERVEDRVRTLDRDLEYGSLIYNPQSDFNPDRYRAIDDQLYHLEQDYLDDDYAIEAIDSLRSLNRQNLEANQPANMPGADRWRWQGLSQEIRRAADQGAAGFFWPDSASQLERYFGSSELDLIDPRLRNRAAGSQRFYQNVYDKQLPREKRLKQLGIKPTPGWNLARRPIRDGDPGRRAATNYWGFELTPDVLRRLGEGIPLYGAGGAAVLGGLYDDEPGQIY